VIEGEPVLELHADDRDRFGPAVEALEGAIEIGREAAESQPMVLEKIRA
jgi:thymidine phosphorylase